MAETTARNAGPDTVSSPTASRRRYLGLSRLSRHELPPHTDFSDVESDHKITLVQFLNDVFREIQREDFNTGFQEKGSKSTEDGFVNMPQLPPVQASATSGQSRKVDLKVDQRIKETPEGNWLARRSLHYESDVKLSELDDLISLNHSQNEANYTPDLYDANELLKWDHDELQKAASNSKHAHNFGSIEMSIFQMFHKMPPISLLQDRVFHVLVLAGRSTHDAELVSKESLSLVVQLPVDFASFSNSTAIMQRSHIKKSRSSWQYAFPSSGNHTVITDTGNPLPQPTSFQKKRQGKKLTEGCYVSLERLKGAPKTMPVSDETPLDAEPVDVSKNCHIWDMMTLSSARGNTLKMPNKLLENGTLKAITQDVEFVIKMIAEQRRQAHKPES